MKIVALILAILSMNSFALSVHIMEKQTNAGLIQYFTVRHNGKLCIMDYNVTTQTVLFHICF